MSVAPVTQQTSLDEAVEAIWEMVKSGEAANTAEATRALWHEFEFSADHREFLALNGLIQYAKVADAATRNTGSPIAIGAPHGKKWDEYLNSLGRTFEAADGRQKLLLDFTLTDLATFATRMRTQADAYLRRADWASTTSELLSEHGVTRVGDLPKFVLRQVAAAAQEAMGRQE